MCCLSFDFEVLLANIFGSKYKKDDLITLENIKKYCGYLDDAINGYKEFDISSASLEKCVNKNFEFYKLIPGDEEKILCLNEPETLNYNKYYLPDIAKRIEKTADLYWIKESNIKQSL